RLKRVQQRSARLMKTGRYSRQLYTGLGLFRKSRVDGSHNSSLRSLALPPPEPPLPLDFLTISLPSYGHQHGLPRDQAVCARSKSMQITNEGVLVQRYPNEP
ncbi:hypothetical protein X777_04599, partial [Ooceraea biroi]